MLNITFCHVGKDQVKLPVALTGSIKTYKLLNDILTVLPVVSHGLYSSLNFLKSITAQESEISGKEINWLTYPAHTHVRPIHTEQKRCHASFHIYCIPP